MTKKKKKPRGRPATGRARGVPVQIYFSELEREGLAKLAFASGDDTLAGVVRRLVSDAISEAGIRIIGRKDPRQGDLF